MAIDGVKIIDISIAIIKKQTQNSRRKDGKKTDNTARRFRRYIG